MICFIHIERAGGTTLDHIVRSNYLSYLTLTPSLWTNEPAAAFTSAELNALMRWLPFTKGFGGHTTRAYLGYEEATRRRVDYFTFLRDPIDRFESHYLYQVERMGIPWSLDAFLDEPRLANFMTTRIAGAADVGRAKELLEERFAFVGLTERFDESLLLLRSTLGLEALDIRYERQRSVQGAQRTGTGLELRDDPSMRERIASRNELDVQLYAFARDVLYPRYVNRYGPGLAGDLARFREQNRGFHFNRRRRATWGLYRKLVYQPLESRTRNAHRRAAEDEAVAVTRDR